MGTVIVPLLAATIFFVLFIRIRRLFVRHRLSVPRLVFRIMLLSVPLAILVVLPSSSMVARALGVALGTALAVGGVLTTKTEREGADLYYRPNPVFGLVIIALLLGRVAQRLLMGRDLAAVLDGSVPIGGVAPDPLSRLLTLAVLSYFAVYYLGILGRSRLGLLGGAAN